MPIYLVSYAKHMLYSEQPTTLFIRRHLNTMVLTNFENLDSISNIFQETHDFLVLTEPVIICIYLRTTGKHFCDQGNVRHPTPKLLKCDLVQTLNTFRNPSLRIFAAGKISLVTIQLQRTSCNCSEILRRLALRSCMHTYTYHYSLILFFLLCRFFSIF